MLLPLPGRAVDPVLFAAPSSCHQAAVHYTISIFNGSSLSSAAVHLATPQPGTYNRCSLMRMALT
eukprot:1136474-Pelagomonas_calceolata.AAC.3